MEMKETSQRTNLLMDSLSDSDVPDLDLIPPTKTKRKKFKKLQAHRTSAQSSFGDGIGESDDSRLPRCWTAIVSLLLFSLCLGLVVLALFTVNLYKELQLLKKSQIRPASLSSDVPKNEYTLTFVDKQELEGKFLQLQKEIQACSCLQETNTQSEDTDKTSVPSPSTSEQEKFTTEPFTVQDNRKVSAIFNYSAQLLRRFNNSLQEELGRLQLDLNNLNNTVKNLKKMAQKQFLNVAAAVNTTVLDFYENLSKVDICLEKLCSEPRENSGKTSMSTSTSPPAAPLRSLFQEANETAEQRKLENSTSVKNNTSENNGKMTTASGGVSAENSESA